MDSQVTLPVAAWAAWRPTTSDASPQVGFIDPQVRRRLSLLDRIALHVTHACVKQGEAARLVFASRHGELGRSAELLTQLAADEVPSPMAFSLSVLNAGIGLYAIARKDRSASTAISSGNGSFPMALIEAAAQASSDAEGAVVCTFADEPPPAVYRELVDSPRAAYALAVRLEPNATHRAVRMRWEPSDVEDDAEAATEAFIACLEGGAAASWRGGGSAWHWTQGGNA